MTDPVTVALKVGSKGGQFYLVDRTFWNLLHMEPHAPIEDTPVGNRTPVPRRVTVWTHFGCPERNSDRTSAQNR